MFWPDPTHQPTHPPTHQIIHPPMGGGVSTDFKSSNRIEISRLVQVLLNFDWFQGSPRGVGGWLDVGGGGDRVPPTHMHMHAHACMHMHIWHHRESQVFPQWGQPFAWNYHVYHARMCVCTCVHACACACVWGALPNHPPPVSTHPPPPEPQGAQNTKIQ